MGENFLENIVPEDNIKFAFMRKAFFPRAVIVGSFFEYLKTAKIIKPFLLMSQTISEKFERQFDSSHFPERKIRAVRGEPTNALIAELVQEAPTFGPDANVAVGGGSVLDLGKIIKKETDLPLIAAPTTPSTGSETTPYALLVDE